MANIIQTIFKEVADMIFPVSCVVCGREEIYLCPKCARLLPRVNNQKCVACQKPSPFGKTHIECASRNKVDGLVSALLYQDKQVKQLIELFKYKFVSDLSQSLAAAIFEMLASLSLVEYFGGFEIVPVPLHKRRFRWRGFNQSEILARPLAIKLGAEFNDSLVQRTVFTQPQVKLNINQRKENIKNAFAASVTDKKILIVDDVVTTGSTINELARVLKQSGAKEVWAITLAADD